MKRQEPGDTVTIDAVRTALRDHANPKHAAILQRFFKTGPGDYGEGDIFLGIKVPVLRTIARAHRTLPIDNTVALLASPLHEERLLALMILIDQYERAPDEMKSRIFARYLSNTSVINNWDLVDLSAPHIVGQHLLNRDRRVLRKLARSGSLWERRIAIIATHRFIRNDQFQDTLDIAEILLNDKHDLIHKAVGWMLREIGKRDHACEEAFLRKHYPAMPRTMLRYAIERFPEKLRAAFLHGTIPQSQKS